MNEHVMKASNVTKFYGSHKALDDVSMNIKKGDIYGFIGRNGAGKTTMIRVIAGLVVPDQGHLQLFGSSGDDIEKERRRIGALIESPNPYPNFTARENLELVKLQRGIPGTKCIDEVLNLVGLDQAGKKKTRNFSLGMRQRLGIAMALLSDPEFLILDEPMNGLDPIGIKETRELLLQLNKERGTTILMSSHILSELTQISTRYGFINNGKIIEEITDGELSRKCRTCISLKVRDASDASVILEKDMGAGDYEVIDGNTLRIYDELESEDISLCLAEHNIGVREMVQVEQSLEDYFGGLIGGCGQ